MKEYSAEIQSIINYRLNGPEGQTLQSGRNLVTKHVLTDQTEIVIKAFKIPNLINRIAYRYFRKSKARRSYEYASRLIRMGIGTPKPIQYFENSNILGLKDSYYISEYADYDLTYRELTTDFEIQDHEQILRAFTRFTYKLHQNNVNFLDHSPGNTLVKRTKDEYNFFLVDLNRMQFGAMDFETRIKNFAKLTIHKSMIKVMSNEYASCTGENEKEIFDLMWRLTKEFQYRYYRKIRIKKRIFFWKKKYKTMVSQSPI